MPTPDPDALVRGIEDLVQFLASFGEHSRIPPFRELVARIKRDGPAREILSHLLRLKDETYLHVRGQIFDGRTIPGKDEDGTMRELDRISGAIFLVIHPLHDPFPEQDISNFAGVQYVKHKRAYIDGDCTAGREIIERAIEFVRHYSQTVGSGDLEAAYALTDSGLRQAMSFKQFVKVHQEAQRQYGGPALEFLIERFAFVLADKSARQKSKTAKEGWQKGTAKDARRCRLIGFWVRDRATQVGCRGSMWLSEENGQYRLANFDFYDD